MWSPACRKPVRCVPVLAPFARAWRWVVARLRPSPRPLRPGEWGEQIAARHLRRSGLRILGRNIRVGRRDELDIIAWEGDTLVFVEVKTRATEQFGPPVSAVGPAKRRHLSRAAVRYLRAHYRSSPPPYVRFDVIEVIGRPGGPRPEVRHLRNVFALEGGYRL